GQPAVDRVTGRVDADGAWTLDVTLTVPRRDERWQMKPVAKFDVRSGGRPSLAWAALEPLENCEVVGDRLLVAPDVRSARFRGVTAVESHPVAAAMAAKTLGAAHLDALLDGHDLDFLVLVSSVAGVWGSAGQS
ncbi:hypothetical protein ADL27_40865, partial [Streptomyces sp. NRRL F-6602]